MKLTFCCWMLKPMAFFGALRVAYERSLFSRGSYFTGRAKLPLVRQNEPSKRAKKVTIRYLPCPNSATVAKIRSGS